MWSVALELMFPAEGKRVRRAEQGDATDVPARRERHPAGDDGRGHLRQLLPRDLLGRVFSGRMGDLVNDTR